MSSLREKSTESIPGKEGDAPISGHCDPRFARVAEAFRENFRTEGEIGASVSIWVDGAPVVDLWGGYADADSTRPWQADTIVNLMSVTKALTATCVHMLVARGRIGLDDPVAGCWPEFAAAGKEGLKLRHILDHRAGLPIIEPALPRGSIYDWAAMTAGLAAMTPLWEPGTVAAYHIRTQGFLLGEVVRRLTGKSVGTYFRDEVARPLGLDLHIGLPPQLDARCADFVPTRQGTIFDTATQSRDSLLYRAGLELPEKVDYNGPLWRRSEIPGGNGHGNARSVARFYAMLVNGGTLDGVTLLPAEAVAAATAEQHNQLEQVMGRQYHQALGFIRNSPPIVWMGPNAGAFGHHGVGGSIGMADPAAGLSFSYVMNRMHARLDNGPRAGRLIKALYDCL